MNKTPRQRRKAKKIDLILDTAKDLIHQKGLENVSLREIAKEADYSPAALYKYFDSKEAIILAVKDRENQSLIDQLMDVDSDLPPTQYLVELCMAYIAYNLEHSTLLILINNLTSERKGKQDPIPANSPYMIFLNAVNAWVNAEKVKVSDEYGAEEITYALWAQTHGMATLRHGQLSGFQADFDRADRTTLEIYLKGLSA